MEHLEGRTAVIAALRARQRAIEVILLKHGLHEPEIAELIALADNLHIPRRSVAPDELNALAHGHSHGGVIALCSAKPRWSGEQLCAFLDQKPPVPAPLLLMLEGVDDARNLGFTIRTADAFGADALLIKKHLWDFDNVEVARPSSGAYERLPLVQIDTVAPLQQLQRRGVRVIACLANAKLAIDQVDLTQPTLLVIGGEKRGVSGAVREICDSFATIPCKPEPSSLSLSHAGAIVLAEAARQRRKPQISLGYPRPAVND